MLDTTTDKTKIKHLAIQIQYWDKKLGPSTKLHSLADAGTVSAVGEKCWKRFFSLMNNFIITYRNRYMALSVDTSHHDVNIWFFFPTVQYILLVF
jgi:hypothetical protein